MPIRGRFIGIDGSAKKDADIDLLRRCHKTVRLLTRGILKSGGGVVVSVGAEERLENADPNTARVFYWTVLDEVESYIDDAAKVGKANEHAVARIVCSQKLRDSIPSERQKQFDKLIAANAIVFESLKVTWNTGAYIREHQAKAGDALVVLGGGEGVEHLASLYVEAGRPVIPLDPRLGGFYEDGSGGAEALNKHALNHPEKFVQDEPEKLVGELHLLSLQRADANPEDIAVRIVTLLERVVRPRVFYVRLLDSKNSHFSEVDQFFQNIVSPCVRELGYEPDQMGMRPGTEPFLNREIFERLHRSGVVVTDLTADRLNNYLECGYALGRPLPTIITAKEGTSLPFDSQAMSVHFWNPAWTTDESKRRFLEFWLLNIKRPSLVAPRELG